jgi:Zn-dependent peptidase ImmA (M78 family)/transcriptional regulator with XRE-family HTH domain
MTARIDATMTPHPPRQSTPTEVEEARGVLPLFDGQRLRLAREALELTQRDLAAAINPQVTPAALSQFEKGDTKPSAATLACLATVTGFPVRFFATDPTVGEVAIVGGFFRSLRSTGARQRRRHRALAEFVRLVAAGLQHHVRLPEPDVPRITVPADVTRPDVIAVARQIRDTWNLPPGPLRHVIRTVERHGAVVTRLPLDSASVDAFSVPFSDWPVVVLGADKGQADRSRWDASHELGHLVMHDPDPHRSRHLEEQANWFAAELLLPADQIVEELPATANWARLAELKVRWGVSMTALLQQARALGVLNESAYVQALKTMSTRGWNRREPVRLPHTERPVLLGRALELAGQQGVTLSTLADEIGLPVERISRIIGSLDDPRPQVTV